MRLIRPSHPFSLAQHLLLPLQARQVEGLIHGCVLRSSLVHHGTQNNRRHQFHHFQCRAHLTLPSWWPVWYLGNVLEGYAWLLYICKHYGSRDNHATKRGLTSGWGVPRQPCSKVEVMGLYLFSGNECVTDHPTWRCTVLPALISPITLILSLLWKSDLLCFYGAYDLLGGCLDKLCCFEAQVFWQVT